MILGVTGQRPKSLGLADFDPREPVWQRAHEFVTYSIGYYQADRLVSGGALGFDMVAAKAALDAGIELELALPFEGYDAWGARDKARLEWLIERAAEHYFVCDPGYAPWKYQTRNERIVDRSDQIIAYHNGARGGTHNCLKYAHKVGVPTHVQAPLDMAAIL